MGMIQNLLDLFSTTPTAAKCFACVSQLQIGSSYLFINGTDNETLIITFQLRCRNIEAFWLSEQGEELISVMPTSSHTDVRVEIAPNQDPRLLVLRPLTGSRYSIKMVGTKFIMTTSLSPQNLENMARMIGDVSTKYLRMHLARCLTYLTKCFSFNLHLFVRNTFSILYIRALLKQCHH